MSEVITPTILNVELDIRSKFSPFDYPKLPEVIAAIEKSFSSDLTKVVKALRGPLMGIYRIESNNYQLYVDKSVTIRQLQVPIVQRTKQDRKPRDGTLVTIYDAYSRQAQDIPSLLFDEYFLGLDGVRVIKQTHPQFYKNTRVLNGNRYLVVDFDPEQTDMGSSIAIAGSQFNLQYNGLQKYCYLCKKKHGRDCPVRQKFEQMKEARKDKLTHKIYADSTLRNINQLALVANVACTSGAGIGQIANVIHLDPEKKDNVIIVAGANEIKRCEDNHEFQFSIDKAAEKLHALAINRNVTVLLPTTPLVTPTEEARFQIMKEVLSTVKSISIIALDSSTIEYEPDNHPSMDGTRALLGQLEEELEEALVLDSDYVVTERKYSQVQACYKVGCRTCTSRDYTNTLCTTCQLASQSIDISKLEGLIKEITERNFPPPVQDNNVDMGDIIKRGLPNNATDIDAADDNDTSSKKAKVSNNVA